MPDFLFADWLGTPAWFWLVFLAIVAVLTAFDLGVLHRKNTEISIKESLKLSAFYIAIAMAFGGWIWMERGSQAGTEYFTGYFIEKALSIDNVFVISLIFTAFAIPARFQYRALVWGIVAVIVLRGLMIGAGAALVSQVLSPLTLKAPITAPTSVPRPPTATQITASIEFAGENSDGLMMPTCGT